jgi:competence ComEA-like helix-hairpin-helix protein
VPRRTGAIPAPSQAAVAPQAPLSVPVEKSAVRAGVPDASSDDLQRLAALAMAQLGDSDESPAEVPSKPEPVSSSEPKIEEAAAVIDSAPAPVPIPVSQPPPVPSPEPPVLPEAISQTVPKPSWASAAPHPAPEPETPIPAASVAFNLNTCTVEDLVKNIPDCSQELAESIVHYRIKIGSFKRIEELLDVPGITKAAYTNLTGETPPDNRTMLSLNELLGFSGEQHVSLKDVTDRIACWPDVTGCVLSQSSGLSLVGTVPESVDKAAIVAFAPRMFESINKSFSEVSGQETDALVIPSSGTSFHLFRNRDLYLIIMSRLPQMPERHVKVARFVLAALSTRKD